jgi:hypothetical protein
MALVIAGATPNRGDLADALDAERVHVRFVLPTTITS